MVKRLSRSLFPLGGILTLVAAYASISDNTLTLLPKPGSDFDIHTGTLLAPILIPRVPGTPGSAAVLQHLANFFQTLDPSWKISFQNSSSKTPLSGNEEVPFTNLIATRDPPWAASGDVGRLNLVAHYDSKISPEGFIGATDSAAPCAMILHAVRSIDAALTRKWNAMQGEADGTFGGIEEHKGIQVLMLDGEEAFLTWAGTDNTYGARSLADQWDNEVHPALSTYRTKLESISLFVLLDLLGAKDPSIPSYFKTTHWAYQNMATLEQRLRQLKQFRSSPGSRWLPDHEKDASSNFMSYVMLDDHTPFINRGVDVLHLIPLGFPSVWHKIEDDGEHLDMPTVEDWALLTTAFAAEWMELEGFFDAPAKREYRLSGTYPISKTEL